MNNIGPHLIGDAFDPARLCGPKGEKPQIVKCVDSSPDFIRRVRAVVGRDCLIVVRFGADQQQLLNASLTNAQEWYSRWIARMMGMNDPNVVFEGYNEINSYAPDLLQAHVEFEVTRLQLMHNAGLRAVVGNYGVGHPDVPMPNHLQAVIQTMKAGDLWGYHSYWKDRAGISNPWYVDRWTLIPALYTLAKKGRLIVTECGRDAMDGGKPGWKLTCGADEYIGDLAEFAKRIGNVRATVFTGGYEVGWEAFGVNDIWDRVTALYTNPIQPPPPPAVDWEARARKAEAKLTAIGTILKQ